jgi:hypothetical protein
MKRFSAYGLSLLVALSVIVCLALSAGADAIGPN